MTEQEFKSTAKEKLQNLPTDDLIVELKKLINDFSYGADMIHDVILDLLMVKMPEQEYVALCNEL